MSNCNVIMKRQKDSTKKTELTDSAMSIIKYRRMKSGDVGQAKIVIYSNLHFWTGIIK